MGVLAIYACAHVCVHVCSRLCLFVRLRAILFIYFECMSRLISLSLFLSMLIFATSLFVSMGAYCMLCACCAQSWMY